jgi:hypothetical protein
LYAKAGDEVLRSSGQDRKSARQHGKAPNTLNIDMEAVAATCLVSSADTAAAIRQALQASIQAQDESLKAQKTLLQLLAT